MRMMFKAILGVILLAAGIFALNQYLERDLDALMRRTAKRPLPPGRLRPGRGPALRCRRYCRPRWPGSRWVGEPAYAAALALLTLVELLSSCIRRSKTRTPHSTLLGAFPGAMPPLLGLGRGAGRTWRWKRGSLFAILFFWQFPHFHSIAWLYRDDYARAAISACGRWWSRKGDNHRDRSSASRSLLLPVSLAAASAGRSRAGLRRGCGGPGIWLLYCGLSMARNGRWIKPGACS